MNEELTAIARSTDFSGVVRISRDGEVGGELARGFADRARNIANSVRTRFAIASGSKGFTALVLTSLVGDGVLTLDTRLCDVVADVPAEVDRRVTIAHLLAHTSGIGDYLDESDDTDVDELFLPFPVEQLVETRDYLPLLRGHAQKFEPGARFEYCNSGYVFLALVAECVTGTAFHDLVTARVTAPAAMRQTSFDPAGAALGYIPHADGWRTNEAQLPARGSGDGGAYSTLDDFDAFWAALFCGAIVAVESLAQMTSAGVDPRYGFGFWLRPDRDVVMLEGYDAGVSFRSAFNRDTGVSYTVMANTSKGAWPLVRELDQWR